jgi:hypothetical protein
MFLWEEHNGIERILLVNYSTSLRKCGICSEGKSAARKVLPSSAVLLGVGLWNLMICSTEACIASNGRPRTLLPSPFCSASNQLYVLYRTQKHGVKTSCVGTGALEGKETKRSPVEGIPCKFDQPLWSFRKGWSVGFIVYGYF